MRHDKNYIMANIYKNKMKVKPLLCDYLCVIYNHMNEFHFQPNVHEINHILHSKFHTLLDIFIVILYLSLFSVDNEVGGRLIW